jgi:hypothetical protein
MRIPVYLGVAQWAFLFALSVLMVVMYRQLGFAFHRPRASDELGPPVGSPAATIEYVRVSDDTVQHLAPGSEQPVLVAFVDATCPSCERLVDAIGVAYAAGELDGLRVLLLISDPPSYLEVSKSFRQTPVEIGQITKQATVDAYKASATPLLVAIDRAGVVRSAGSAVHLSEVRTFKEACLGSALQVTTVGVVTSRSSESMSQPADSVAGRN